MFEYSFLKDTRVQTPFKYLFFCCIISISHGFLKLDPFFRAFFFQMNLHASILKMEPFVHLVKRNLHRLLFKVHSYPPVYLFRTFRITGSVLINQGTWSIYELGCFPPGRFPSLATVGGWGRGRSINQYVGLQMLLICKRVLFSKCLPVGQPAWRGQVSDSRHVMHSVYVSQTVLCT